MDTTFDLGEEAAMRLNFSGMMSRIDGDWAWLNEEVRGLLGAGSFIDEMALYFPNEQTLFRWVSVAVRNGWTLFNQADDSVTTHPLISRYEVRYWFLRREGVPYRVEAMTIAKGHSPYHGVLCAQRRDYYVAHASFSTPNEEKYAAANFTLKGVGYELLQRCDSTYGRFSYWSKPKLPCPIKPRVNLRDAKNGANSGN